MCQLQLLQGWQTLGRAGVGMSDQETRLEQGPGWQTDTLECSQFSLSVYSVGVNSPKFWSVFTIPKSRAAHTERQNIPVL